MEITVDRERCIGAGSCVYAEPDVFDQSDDDARVVLLRQRPAPEQEDSVLEAVARCPVSAIEVAES